MVRKKSKLKNAFFILIAIIPIVGVIISLVDPKNFLDQQFLWRERLFHFGIFAPIIFVIIQALQVIITPISHYTTGVIGGFVFGPFYGGFLNWVGRIIGHSVTFYLSRRFGRKIVNRFVDEKTLNTFDRYVSGGKGVTIQSLILFLVYFLPFFPDDEISYIVGLSKMQFGVFLLANVFGHLGGSFSLAYLGNGLNTNDPFFWVLFLSTLAGFPVIWYLMRNFSKTQAK